MHRKGVFPLPSRPCSRASSGRRILLTSLALSFCLSPLSTLILSPIKTFSLCLSPSLCPSFALSLSPLSLCSSLSFTPTLSHSITLIHQGVYFTGLSLLMVFFGHHEMWHIFFPIGFEVSCLVYLTGLKIYFEECLRLGKEGKAVPPAAIAAPVTAATARPCTSAEVPV